MSSRTTELLPVFVITDEQKVLRHRGNAGLYWGSETVIEQMSAKFSQNFEDEDKDETRGQGQRL